MDYIEVKGSYYEVGYQMGQKTKHSLEIILKDFKDGSLYSKIVDYVSTEEGRQVVDKFRNTVQTYMSHYLQELKGLADGAFVSFDDLFLIVISHDFKSIVDHVPGSSHGVVYASLYDGCTNISMDTEDGQLLLAHNEDISPACKDLSVMIKVVITNPGGKVIEDFVEFYVPGERLMEALRYVGKNPGRLLRNGLYLVFVPKIKISYRTSKDHHLRTGTYSPRFIMQVYNVLKHFFQDVYIGGFVFGSRFGFNSHGVMMVHNSIVQKDINLNGLPRKFMCRALCGVRNGTEAIRTLETKPGMATSCAFQIVQRTNRGVENIVVEVANTDSERLVTSFNPSGFYHHCNILQHMNYSCNPGESSVHRAAVLSQYMNRGERFDKLLLCKAISNTQDPNFPVYRTGRHPDYLATSATGIFDVNNGTLEVYTDKPSESLPVHMFNIPNIKQ